MGTPAVPAPVTQTAYQDVAPECGGDPAHGDGTSCRTCDAPCPIDPHRD